MPGAEGMIEQASGFVSTADGVRLFAQHWTAERPRAVLCLVHGLAEHSDRYGFVVEHFVPRGWACAAVDLRGHGRSDGRRVHIRSRREWSHDVAALAAFATERHPDLPKILVGHSMGGLIALAEALERPQPWQGVVASSPALGAHPDSAPPPWLEALSRVLSVVAPGLLIASGLDARAISRDPAIVASYLDDPLVSHKVSPRWYTETRALMEEVMEAASRLEIPALVMQSGADRLTNPVVTQRWAKRAPDELVDFELWEGFFHEMFNEPERGHVFERIEGWLESLPIAH